MTTTMPVTLFYSPGACSLSPHIVAEEAGLDFTLAKVNLREHTLTDGSDYLALNPKGYVPAIRSTEGEMLTEGTAIVQYLADLKPETKLAPPNGTMARVRLQELLGYINSELHKSYSPLFNPASSPEAREAATAHLLKRYRFIEDTLKEDGYLLGDTFSVADAYLFTVTNWSHYTKLDLSMYPKLLAFQTRVAARPAVKRAMASEGLNK
jgi:glutathione S-transferase